MSDIVFEVMKLLVMISVIVVTRYLVPLIRAHIDASKLSAVATWAEKAVLKAQQVMSAKSGEDRKAFVTEFLKEILTAKNISISDEQLDILIESAVKRMKMDENAGIVIEATDEIETE
jgi:hypothetical protein